MTVEFQKGETLRASKLNAVSKVAFGNRISGSVVNTGSRKVIGLTDTRNYTDQLKPFEVLLKDATNVTLEPSWWTYYYSYAETTESPVLIGRVEVDYDESELEVTETGFAMLKLNVADNTLTAISSPVVPDAEPNIYYKKLATVTVTGGIISDIEQHWDGGDMLTVISLAESEEANDGLGGIGGQAPISDCNQNTHPSDPDEGGGEESPTDHPADGGGGETFPDEEDDDPTSHPSDPDCYSTIPDPIT